LRRRNSEQLSQEYRSHQNHTARVNNFETHDPGIY
jgi:hypothetical protein